MSGTVAIVTGASQGIGQATAIRLAHDFSAGVPVAGNRANLEQASEAMKATGAVVIDADLTRALRGEIVAAIRDHLPG